MRRFLSKLLMNIGSSYPNKLREEQLLKDNQLNNQYAIQQQAQQNSAKLQGIFTQKSLIERVRDDITKTLIQLEDLRKLEKLLAETPSHEELIKLTKDCGLYY